MIVMRTRIAAAFTALVATLALGGAVAIGKASSGGTTTQSTSIYDFAGKGCGDTKDHVRNC
jgi:hypothetical protein